MKPRLTDPSTNALVKQLGQVTMFPIDLGLRWVFQNPEDGSTEVLYGWDTELRWTEVIAGVRTGLVPSRYVPHDMGDCLIHEPMN